MKESCDMSSWLSDELSGGCALNDEYITWRSSWGVENPSLGIGLTPEFLDFPDVMYFFCLARQFWNQTCVTLLLSPVICAILSRSWPSGFESIWKFACRIWTCSSVNVVRILFV